MSRIEWVDQAKGWGILLVMAGHAPFPPLVNMFIYTFHMPLFFLLSGLFLSVSTPVSEFLHKQFQRLILPYLAFAAFSYTVWVAIRPFSKVAKRIPFIDPVLGTLYGVGSQTAMPHNLPLWFLPTLFMTLLLVYGLRQLPKAGQLPATVLVGVLGLLMPFIAPFRLPWSLDVALVAAPIVALGQWYRVRFAETSSVPAIVWAGLFAFAGWIGMTFNSRIDMNYLEYGNGLVFYPVAIAMSFSLMELCKRLPVNAVIGYLGRNSLFLFGLHSVAYLLMIGLSKKILHLPMGMDYDELMRANPAANPYVVALAMMAFGIVFSLSLQWFFAQATQLIGTYRQRTPSVRRSA